MGKTVGRRSILHEWEIYYQDYYTILSYEGDSCSPAAIQYVLYCEVTLCLHIMSLNTFSLPAMQTVHRLNSYLKCNGFLCLLCYKLET